MKKIFSLMTIAAGLLALVGCKDDLDSQSGSATPYSGINFNMTSDSPNTRTQYASNDWLQIEWVEGDKITLACNQTQAPISNDATNLDESNWASKTSAMYEVSEVIAYPHTVDIVGGTTTITTNSKARIKPSSSSAKDALYWGKNEVDHVFYAAYGEEVTIDPATGMATCTYQSDQFLTENTARNEWINMEQAYMVATKTTKPVDNVDLHFKPIMTTLAIDVQGPAAGEVILTAMEIDLPASLDVVKTDAATNKAYFDFNITNADNGGTVEDKASTEQTAKKYVFTFSTPKVLRSGEHTQIVALLPPVAISSTNEISLTIDATEGFSFKKFSGMTVPAGNKMVITAGPWQKKTISAEEGNDKDYVDLGLPSGVKWATCNLGANTPYECGNYYAWGCTIPFSSNSFVEFPLYFKKIGGTGTKMSDCGTAKDPLTGMLNIAGTQYDAAHVRLGGNWRMPTKADMDELLDNCTTTELTTSDGKTYWKLTSKISGYTDKYIILPASGGRYEGLTLYVGRDALYWSANPDGTTGAKDMRFGPDKDLYGYFYRCDGASIRPVYVENIPQEVDLGLSVKWADKNLGANTSTDFGDIYGWGCTTPYDKDKEGFEYWNTALYWKTLGKSDAVKGTDYFNQNDTIWKDNNDYTTVTSSSLGNAKKPISKSKWDAASVNLGGGWYIPTKAQWDELFDSNNCQWDYDDGSTTGVKGWKVTSKVPGYEGNSIFLPAAGYSNMLNAYVNDGTCQYWSSLGYGLDDDNYCENAWFFTDYPSSKIPNAETTSRYWGMSIRPVCDRNPVNGTPANYGKANQMLK